MTIRDNIRESIATLIDHYADSGDVSRERLAEQILAIHNLEFCIRAVELMQLGGRFRITEGGRLVQEEDGGFVGDTSFTVTVKEREDG